MSDHQKHRISGIEDCNLVHSPKSLVEYLRLFKEVVEKSDQIRDDPAEYMFRFLVDITGPFNEEEQQPREIEWIEVGWLMRATLEYT